MKTLFRFARLLLNQGCQTYGLCGSQIFSPAENPCNQGEHYFDGLTDRLGSYYVKEGRGADVPKTASAVVQAGYTERQGSRRETSKSVLGDTGYCKAEYRIHQIRSWLK